MQKVRTKAITEGAIFTAIYVLILLATQYLFTSVDSMIYYVTPLPLAIYTARNSLKESMITTCAIILLSFIFGNPLSVALLHLPNLLIGFTFGTLKRNKVNQIINYLITFAFAFIANLLSVYLFERISGIGYFDDIIVFAGEVFPIIDGEIIKNIVEIVAYAVLLVDAFVKVLFISLLFSLLVKRLNLVNDNQELLSIKFSFIFPIVFLISFVTFGCIFASTLSTTISIYAKIVMIVAICITCIMTFYFFFQVSFAIAMYVERRNATKGVHYLLVILSLIIFPATITMAIVLNFTNPFKIQ